MLKGRSPVKAVIARKGLIITTSISAFLTPFSSSVLTFAVPQIGYAFRASFYQVVWIPILILFPLPSFMMLFGKLSDIKGRVKMYRIGALIFAASAVAAFFSQNIIFLDVFVFMMGVGAALISTNATALISQAFKDKGRGFALGINAMSVYLGLTMAPFAGGFLIQAFGWHSVLLVNAPLALAAFIISLFSMKDLELEKLNQKIDVAGALTFVLFLASIVLFLSMSEIYGFAFSFYVIPFAIMLFVIFFLVEKKSKNPLIDVNLFMKNRTFTASNITALLNYIATYSIVFVFTIYLQVMLGISPEKAGLILVAEPVFMVIFSPISGLLAERYGSRILASIGMLLIGISFMMLYVLNLRNTTNILISLSVLGIGFGLFSAPNTNSVMASAPPGSYGLASGTLGTMRFTGQLLSVTIASLFLASSMSRKMLLLMFSGIYAQGYSIFFGSFMKGLKEMMLFSAVISFIGAYTSLLKNKGE